MHSSINKMTSKNLAVCWTPTLFGSNELTNFKLYVDITQFLIENFNSIFN